MLVEVALVKLCKPQMEQNLESVLERVRILEEKMERGIPMMVTNAPGAGNGSAGGYGAGAGDGYAAAETPQSAPAPVKAAPADLQRISASWKAIVGQTKRHVPPVSAGRRSEIQQRDGRRQTVC